MKPRKLIAEFIGTFFLTLAVCMTAYAKVSADMQPLAIGLVLTALVYAGGYVSGAVYNPAVAVALWLRGRLDIKEMGAFVVVQMLAAVAAAGITLFLTSAKALVLPIAAPPQYFALLPTLLAEILGAFAFVWIYLNIATSKSIEGNSFYGLAIGLSAAGLLYIFGSVSGSIFNPAVAVASAVVQISSWQFLWIYGVGSFGGGALAALAYRYFNTEEM